MKRCSWQLMRCCDAAVPCTAAGPPPGQVLGSPPGMPTSLAFLPMQRLGTDHSLPAYPAGIVEGTLWREASPSRGSASDAEGTGFSRSFSFMKGAAGGMPASSFGSSLLLASMRAMAASMSSQLPTSRPWASSRSTKRSALSEVTAPTGVTVSKDTDATSPTLTFSLAATVAAGGTITIPVHVGTDITINKTFSFSIAFKGSTGKGVSSTGVTYQVSGSGTTAPTGTWSTSIPTVGASQYLWTRTVITYTDSTTSTAYSVGMMGAKGDPGTPGTDGADALTLVVTSSNGLIFKNSSIATVLTAHVYKAGVEQTGTALTALGTVKWYKDGSTTAAATGQTLTIDAGDVTGKATYVAQLEG
jgi:hypothetical protein